MDENVNSSAVRRNQELRKKLEDATQELYTVKQKLLLQQRNEEFIQDSMDEVERIKADLELENQAEDTEYDQQLQDLECELDDKQMQIYELEDLVRQLESAKDEQKNTSMTESFDQPRHGEQPSFNDEISKLSEENDQLREILSELQEDLEKLKPVKAKLEKGMNEKCTMIEKIKSELNSYADSLEHAEKQNAEKQMELEAMTITADKSAPRENSVFDELNDRRVESEKTLAMLQSQLKSFQEKYLEEHRKNFLLKMQRLQMEPRDTEEDEEENDNLRLEIINTNNKITTLIQTLKMLDETSVAVWDKVSEVHKSAGLDSVQNKEFTNFLLAMLKSKEKELIRIKTELRNESLVYWDLNTKCLEKAHSNFLLDKTNKRLQSHILEMNFKLEDLITKYQPEKVSEKNPVTVVKREKIQDFSLEESNSADNSSEIEECKVQ